LYICHFILDGVQLHADGNKTAHGSSCSSSDDAGIDWRIGPEQFPMNVEAFALSAGENAGHFFTGSVDHKTRTKTNNEWMLRINVPGSSLFATDDRLPHLCRRVIEVNGQVTVHA
jgi:hypothetical protein